MALWPEDHHGFVAMNLSAGLVKDLATRQQIESVTARQLISSPDL